MTTDTEAIPDSILRAVAVHLNEQNYGTGTPIQREANNFYPTAKKVMLQNHYWTFAEKQVKLEKLLDESGNDARPEFGFSNLFNLPDDFISLTYLNNSGSYRVQSLRYQLLEDKLATNSQEAYMSYTRDITDSTKFSPVFEYTLGLFIAQNLCFNITRNMDREIYLLRSFKRQQMESIEIEHRNTPLETVQDTGYIDARNSSGAFDPDPQLEITPTPLYPGG